jgi:hypothetical protein
MHYPAFIADIRSPQYFSGIVEEKTIRDGRDDHPRQIIHQGIFQVPVFFLIIPNGFLIK